MDSCFLRTVTKAVDVVFPDRFKTDKLRGEIVDSTEGLYFSRNYMLASSNHFILSETFAIMSKVVGSDKFRSVKEFAEKAREASDEAT